MLTDSQRELVESTNSALAAVDADAEAEKRRMSQMSHEQMTQWIAGVPSSIAADVLPKDRSTLRSMSTDNLLWYAHKLANAHARRVKAQLIAAARRKAVADSRAARQRERVAAVQAANQERAAAVAVVSQKEQDLGKKLRILKHKLQLEKEDNAPTQRLAFIRRRIADIKAQIASAEVRSALTSVASDMGNCS